ncbi:unnamed protein product, partial [Effrenium voratum]
EVYTLGVGGGGATVSRRMPLTNAQTMIRTAPDGLRVVLANPNWLFGRGHMKEE